MFTDLLLVLLGEGRWAPPHGFRSSQAPVYYDTFDNGNCYIWRSDNAQLVNQPDWVRPLFLKEANLKRSNGGFLSFSCSFRQKFLPNIWVFTKCFTEFSDKMFVTTSRTHMRDRILTFTQIHALVVYQIPWICWIHWIPIPFRDNCGRLRPPPLALASRCLGNLGTATVRYNFSADQHKHPCQVGFKLVLIAQIKKLLFM